MAAPDIYSNYYITTGYGGWSPCIEGNNYYGLQPFPGSVLPNCVGYTVGRFNELLGLNACPWLGSVNAKDIYDLARSQGLQVGNIPRVGGLICWDAPYPLEGHCAIIEEVIDNNTVKTSESGWNYTVPPIITEHTRTRVNGDFYYGISYIYQGIVYPPLSGLDLDYYIMFLNNEGVNYDRRKDF